MISITQQEESLFSEWREKRPDFVADGVVDEQAYLSKSPKLLFVLKEVNDPDGGEWDLREFLRKGGRPQTWNNITRWVEGIRGLSIDLPWAGLEQVDEERRCNAVRSIAAINLKKSPGGHTSNVEALATIATEDKVFLNRQFSLYAPDIVICCGSSTSDVFHWLVDFKNVPDWKTTRRGVQYHEFMPGKHIIRYAHPGARVADNLLYYGLVDAIREILKESING